MIYEKLLEVQKAAPAISKDAVNPHFRNTYATLDTILETVVPMLNERGLVLTQQVAICGNTEAGFYNSVISRITDSESGEFVVSEQALVPETNPQKLGSAITYARRYTLMALLALTADEDDDGNAASTPVREVVNADRLYDPQKPLF